LNELFGSRDRLILPGGFDSRFLPLDPFAYEPRQQETSSSLQGEAAADLDDVVGDNAKADPALRTFETSIAAAIQSVAPLKTRI